MCTVPKIIHYCWFGGKPIPEEYKKYINSWKKYLPDYEIKEWNETNFDLNSCDYIKEAYKCRKWAFVSDYARFWILYNYGGLYFDTDVEIIQPMGELIKKGPFMGLENMNGRYEVNSGLGLCSNPGHSIYKEILEMYSRAHFLNEDGTQNLENVVSRVTRILKKYGFKDENIIQEICGVTLYPSDYFCPMDCINGRITITSNTYTIHHYACSWLSPWQRFKKKIQLTIGPTVTTIVINIKKRIRNV